MEARLRRGLFGYSRKSVTAVVNDREVSITKASSRGERGEGRGREARRPRSTRTGSEIVDLQARNRDLESKLEDAAERFRAVERSGSTSTTEGLTDVLHAAERALARLSDRARENAEQQLGETERVRDTPPLGDRSARRVARPHGAARRLHPFVDRGGAEGSSAMADAAPRGDLPGDKRPGRPCRAPDRARRVARASGAAIRSRRMRSSRWKRRASNPAPRCPMPNSGSSHSAPRSAGTPRAASRRRQVGSTREVGHTRER